MSANNNGGAAFPQPAHGFTAAQPGATLRDYFAAKAMQAAATNETGANGFTFKERAEWAYLQADAMLKARNA